MIARVWHGRSSVDVVLDLQPSDGFGKAQVGVDAGHDDAGVDR